MQNVILASLVQPWPLIVSLLRSLFLGVVLLVGIECGHLFDQLLVTEKFPLWGIETFV